MLRLIHTADWHLGQSLHGVDRGVEHAAFLEHLTAMTAEREAHALLIAGDVFHHANPPLEAMRQFFGFIRGLRAASPMTHLIVIAGNHDSGARLELPLALGADPKLTLLGAPPRRAGRPDPAAALTPIRDETDAVRAVALGLPYPRPGDLSQSLSAAPARRPETTRDEAQDRPIRRYLREGADAAAALWPGAPLIIAAHLHVAGGLAGAESERPILIGGEEATPLSDFPSEAAYVALGHLHRPQTLSGAPLARYSGPPIPLSLDERAHTQSVTVATIGAQGAAESEATDPTQEMAARETATRETVTFETVTLEMVALPRRRGFLRAPERGALTIEEAEEALAALAAPYRSDADAALRPPFLEVTLRLERPEPDARRRLEEALGDAPLHLARLRRLAPEPAPGAAEAETGQEAADAGPPTPGEAFDALHLARFGAPPEAPLRAAFDALVRAVLNEDEAAMADRPASPAAGGGDGDGVSEP